MFERSKYIKDYFLELSISKIPSSLYVIRKSLLCAIDELKPDIKGVVLDLGCGVMPYKEYLSNALIENYIGVDLENSIYHNSVKPDLYWDGVKIPMDDSSCDYVIATEFFEHYFDTSHILQEIKRVLKEDGRLFFTVPSIWPIHEAPFDYHRFTPFSLQKLFEDLGFSDFVVKPLGGLHTSLALVLSFWFERISFNRLKWVFKPIFFWIIKSLLKREKRLNSFQNGQVYSGLFGFVSK